LFALGVTAISAHIIRGPAFRLLILAPLVHAFPSTHQQSTHAKAALDTK
jgi:hypothetical protein